MSTAGPAQSPRGGRTRRDRLERASASLAKRSRSGAAGAARRVERLTGAQGAGESGLARMIEVHGFNAAGDAALAVSLAGTVFFTVPSGEARDRVALFLLLTMAPFAVLAPLLGPFLDRVRHGRRWSLGTTFCVRGFLAWSLADVVTSGSNWLYPAALGCLVASKAYGITRASGVPRLLPDGISLVTANSRISVAGIVGAAVSGGVAAGLSRIGPDWSLRWATLVYLGGMVLTITLNARVDSEPVDAGEPRNRSAAREARKQALAGLVNRAITCNMGLRFVSGFLVIFLAFLLREHPLGHGPLLAAAVAGAAGLGSGLGTFSMALLKSRSPEITVLVVLGIDIAVAVAAAVFYGLITLLLIGLMAGLCQQLGKLALDALIQRDAPETVRTSVFARSETLLQLAWVVGGGVGIVLPLRAHLGFGCLAAVVVLIGVLVVRQVVVGRRRTRLATARAAAAPLPDQPGPFA